MILPCRRQPQKPPSLRLTGLRDKRDTKKTVRACRKAADAIIRLLRLGRGRAGGPKALDAPAPTLRSNGDSVGTSRDRPRPPLHDPRTNHRRPRNRLEVLIS